MNELPTFSASKLKTFSTCARKYFYHYIEKLPSEKSTAALLGTSVHKTIEEVYRNKIEPSMYFTKHFMDSLAEYNLKIENTQYSDGLIMVTDYPYNDTVPTQLELEFRLPFPSVDSPVCMIHGFLDQVFDWGFIDLKTNKRKPTQRELDNDLQFILYHWAFGQLFGKPPEKSIWHHLRTQKRMEANVGDKLQTAIDAIGTVMMAKKMKIFPVNRAFHCRWCSFKDPCFASDEIQESENGSISEGTPF